MKTWLMATLTLLIGMGLGYFGLPLLHPYSPASTEKMPTTPGAVTRSVVACDLSPEQIDRLSSRIAPAVVEHLATSGLQAMSADPKIAGQQRQAQEQDKIAKAEAFTHATQLIDQMIASHQVTPQGLEEARQLLQQTGQSDQIYLLHARISMAINRRELTPEQAGMIAPSH